MVALQSDGRVRPYVIHRAVQGAFHVKVRVITQDACRQSIDKKKAGNSPPFFAYAVTK